LNISYASHQSLLSALPSKRIEHLDHQADAKSKWAFFSREQDTQRPLVVPKEKLIPDMISRHFDSSSFYDDGIINREVVSGRK
jgi:hypothetical protein